MRSWIQTRIFMTKNIYLYFFLVQIKDFQAPDRKSTISKHGIFFFFVFFFVGPMFAYLDPYPCMARHLFEPVLRIRIGDPVPFWPLDPGSGIGFFPGSRISDPGSRIPNPYFWKLSDNFLGKKFYNFLKIGLNWNFFLQHFKNKIIYNFVKFVATKKRYDNKFFFTPLFCSCFWIRDLGSEIRDPRYGILDPGSEIQYPGYEIRDV